jgi:hypothetical protein
MNRMWSEIVISVLILVGAGLALMGLLKHAPKSKVYNCSLAEFHPDFPIAVKEQCRYITKQQVENTK